MDRCKRRTAEHPRDGVGGMHRWAGDLRDQLGASISLDVMKLWLPKESKEMVEEKCSREMELST